MLATIHQAGKLIAEGRALIIAGEEDLLRSLPRGNWIGGTIPYFMTLQGGVTSREHLFVEQVPAIAAGSRIRTYDTSEIAQIGVNSPEHGYTVLIIPAFSQLHQSYALNAPGYPELFFKVIAGWIAGIHLDDFGSRSPMVFCGTTGEASTTKAVALEVQLPADHAATLGIVNIFEQGAADEITFPASGFTATECLINGVRENFHDYFVRLGLDQRLPLIADFCGALVNVSIQSLLKDSHSVQFYAPVFDAVKYRFAKPLEDYSGRFCAAVPAAISNPAFSCNCVLNYVYGNLQGRSTGSVVGPMTFGEIGYQLLNQTMVYVTVQRMLPG